MKPRNAEQKLVEAQGRIKAKKPRFKIEKLEERIAPHSPKIYGPHDHGGGGKPCTPHDRACSR